MRGIPLRCPYLYTIKRNKSVMGIDILLLTNLLYEMEKVVCGICGFFRKEKEQREIVEFANSFYKEKNSLKM